MERWKVRDGAIFGFELVFWIIGAFEFIVAISIMLIIPKEIDINDDSLLVESNESNQILRSYEQMNQLNIVFDAVYSPLSSLPVNLRESWSLNFLQKIYVKNYAF